MRVYEVSRLCAAVLGAVLVSAGVVVPAQAQLPPVPAGATLVETGGLYGPRGLKFGPDGNLYVATSGTANPQTGEKSACPLVPGGPPEPVPGGRTSETLRRPSLKSTHRET